MLKFVTFYEVCSSSIPCRVYNSHKCLQKCCTKNSLGIVFFFSWTIQVRWVLNEYFGTVRRQNEMRVINPSQNIIGTRKNKYQNVSTLPNFGYSRKICVKLWATSTTEKLIFFPVFLQLRLRQTMSATVVKFHLHIARSSVGLSDILHVLVSEVMRKNNGRVRRVRQREITIYAFFPLVMPH